MAPASRCRAAAAAAVAALLALSACGGSGDGGAPARTGGGPGTPEPAAAPAITTSSAPGKAEFVTRADSVCADYRHDIAPVDRGLARALRGARQAPRVAALLDRGAAAADRAVRRIGALTPPHGDERTIAAYLDTGREAARALRGAAAAVRAQHAAAADRRMSEVRLASARGRTIATRYGFLVCGTANPQAS